MRFRKTYLKSWESGRATGVKIAPDTCLNQGSPGRRKKTTRGRATQKQTQGNEFCEVVSEKILYNLKKERRRNRAKTSCLSMVEEARRGGKGGKQK